MLRTHSFWLAIVVMAAAGLSLADEPPEPRVGVTLAADQPAEEPESDEAAEQRRLIEEVVKQQAAERGTVADVRRTASFQPTRAIKSPRGEGSILAFHPLSDGGLVIATGINDRYGEQSIAGAVASLLGFGSKKPKDRPANQLIWLDAAGAEQQAAPLPFACKGVTVAPDGEVIAVGSDRVVVFSAAGEQVAEAQAPHFNLSDEELATLREQIAEQHREEVKARRDQWERTKKVVADLEEVPEDDRTLRQKKELIQAKQMMRSYAAMLAVDNLAGDAAVTASLGEARTIHRVAASRDHLFLVAHEPAGYGFGVWRCGRDFSGPEKIVDGLRGCCGQMDVQVIGDELVIAENSRHHVAVYGLDGEPRRTFGKASRTDIREGFGGCCNPMNACPGPDGSLLLSESNGLVKQFNSEGELVEILGAADVESGCKNSSIGLSADASTLYYLDIQAGRVLVMEKRP
jgi:hypothetical protein